MKTIAGICLLVALAYSSPIIRQEKFPRRYFPEEDDPYHIKYLYYPDENGTFHYEDLTALSVESRAVKAKDVNLYLYRRYSEKFEVFGIGEAGNLILTDFYDPKKPNFFVIHGWTNDHLSEVNSMIKDAIFEKEDMNVFVVDWSKHANKLYTSSKGSVPQVGQFVGMFINSMMDIFKLSPKMFKMAGHSLGAHVAGCAGAEVNGLIDYIIGMDPASPLFTVKNTDNRLDSTDADFVQIVHTSSFLGFQSSIGDADFYPNDGASQPGCGISVVGTCSHSRSYEYVAESIVRGGFESVECKNWKQFKKGNCDDNSRSYMGSLNVDKSANGDYYLHTNKRSLFGAYGSRKV